MDRLRILLFAPEANPDGICGSLIGYSEAQALAQLHDVTLLIRPAEEESVRRKQGSLRSVEVVRLHLLDAIFNWAVRSIFKNDYMTHAQSLTAFVRYPYSVAFEWQAWRQLRARIMAGEFDIALRLLPISAVLPSPIAYFLRGTHVPFVIGPISGGLPWPSGFRQAQKHKQWISGLRGLYRFMPFTRSTYRDAAAIITGASQTYGEFAEYSEKLFFVLENGVDSSLCSEGTRNPERANGKLELIFVGGLTPVKACDIGLRAAATVLRRGVARFTIVGDGPERQNLEELTRSLGIEDAVTFCGMLSHVEAMDRLRSADVLVFPSVRDNNPAVVFEAIAAGVVPVVADFGGPGDTVRPDVGFRVPLTDEDDVVLQFEKILTGLVQDRENLHCLQQQCVRYAKECLTWDAKAQIFTSIMRWALRRGPKPNLPSPKMPQVELMLTRDVEVGSCMDG
jgi:glycosyltransferase involved in cell wall biosynthesis